MINQQVACSRSARRGILAVLALGFSVGALAAPSIKPIAGAAHLQLAAASYELTFPASKSSVNARAVSLLSADFNTDGYADLISGYAQTEGSFITLHRGNPEAYAPTGASALANLARGIYPAGFTGQAQIWNLPVAPELLVAGDFNADGDSDLVFAQLGDHALYFMPGSRTGFGAAQKIALNGAVDAIAAGEIDLPNAALDLAVAITGDTGASLKIFRDGIASKALDYPLPATATQLAIGNVDDNLIGDVVLLEGGKLSILHGYDQRDGVPVFNHLEALDVGTAVQSFALGNFIWDREGKTELALLQADGSVVIAARGTLNTQSFSVSEVREKRRAQNAAKSAVISDWQPGSGGGWKAKESNVGVVSKAMAMRGTKLLRANLAGQPADDLIIVDAPSQTLTLLTVEGAQRKRYDLATKGEPVAALSIPTSNFVLPSLIVLAKGAAAPSILSSVPNANFTVSKTADTNDGVCNADCSLREAIGAANAAAGADSIVLPAGTYQLTIANTGNANEDGNDQGDLDVNDALTITGAGAATTIVRAGTTTGNGIDKVFAFNPICSGPMNTALSNVTIRFGRNSQPKGAFDYSENGGGMDWCGTGSSSMTITNSVFDSNTNTLGYGGGINLDSISANGSVVITGSTISANRVLSGNNTGGGVNLYADQHSVTVTNSIITGNTSPGEGGGLYVRHSFGGAVLIQGSTISNNIAASRGGGVSNFNQGAATFTINQDSLVSGNTSQGLSSLAAEGGGIYSNSPATTTINEVTITGNSATGAALPEQRGGGGIATGGGTVNITFSRIVGNSALGLGGSGIHKDANAGTTIATNNWWGCNAGAASAPCDRAVVEAGAGTLVSTPHLVLNHAASPNTIVVGQTSALTADFLTNSASAAIAVANLDAMIGTAHAHNNPVRGTLAATQSVIQPAGNATATFTATSAGAGSASSVVDSQTRTAAITISKANTVTSITSDNPDPSVGGGVVAVNYTVAVSAPGAGAPTGNVVVTVSGGAETCTGSVAAGTCNIVLTALGNRTLTATYAGDANFNASNDTEAHTVNSPLSVSIAVAPASVSEDGAADLVFTVTRDVNLASATVVNITTSGTAASGTDYSGGVATVSIPAGSLAATITINPTVDGTIEADETVVLTVATGAGYSVGTPASATGTLVNDDVPSVSIAVVPAAVAEDGAANLSYTVTLDQVALSGTSVNFTVGGSATPGTDYAAVTSPLVIPAGNLTGSVTVDPTVDTTIEADETVILTIAPGVGYNVGAPSNATGTIVNDDLPSLAINDVTLSEGNAGTSNATFTVSLSAPAGPGGVNFDITTANGTATAGTDYAAQGPVAQTIAAGSSSATVTVLINGDLLNEPNETYFVNVTSVVNAVVSDGQGMGTITNDDPLPSLSINNASLTEGNVGSANMVFTVTLNAISGQTVNVDYATTSGTATAGTDFTTASGTLTFTPGQISQPINVPVLSDTSPESNETFTVTLATPTNAAITTAVGSGTIIDDDTTLSINDVTLAEGNVGTSLATFTVSLSQPAGAGGVTFDITTANATASAGNDYVARSLTTQTIAAGASTYSFDVTINGDVLNEPNETFDVNVSNIINAIAVDGQGQGTITNDDPLPTLAINDVMLTEGNAGTSTATFTVTMSAASGQNVTVNYATANASATAGSDYVANSAMLTFTAGQTTQTIGVIINGDIVPETNETFTVVLSAATNANIAVATGTGTITDDDIPVTVGPGSLPATVVAAPYAQTISASGGAGPYTFAVSAGALPAGITLSPAGALAGTSTAGGSFNFSVTATDSSPLPGPFTGTQMYTLTVNAATVVLPVAVLPVGVTGVPYAANLTAASGGTAPYSYAVTAGALPGGVLMDTAGAFSGTPTVGGSFNFTVTATDSSTGTGPYTASRSFTIAVTAITIDPPTLPAGTAGLVYTQTLTANGGSAPYTFSVSSGALPAGLTLSGAGVVSGTPTAAGTFNFAVEAQDLSSAPGTRAYTLTIAAPTLTLTPIVLSAGTAGVAYAQTITAAGGIAPYSYAITSGALPAGLALGIGGNLAGTPTVAGPFNFSVTATDSTGGTAGTGTSNYTLTVAAPTISLATAQVPAPVIDTAYSATLIATGGTAPYTYAVTAGTLPAGLSLSPAGVLSGTPSTLGLSTFTITATDALGFIGTRVFNVTVVEIAIPVPVGSPLSLAMLAFGMLLGGLLLVRRHAPRTAKGLLR